MTHLTVLRSTFAFIVMLFLSATVHAQLFRAYLAPSGNDANPCTLPAPCRLFPAALTAVADGGEIWMLDSGNYNTGPVNITKSVTILAVPGALGSVVAAGGNAINIATAGVKVALRNLVIAPLLGGGGVSGIFMTAGASLTVENCLIANLPGEGIYVTSAASVRVTDTTIRDNDVGLYLQSGARATVTRATVSGSFRTGIVVSGSSASTTTTADIADSTVDGNAYGVNAVSTNASAVVQVSVHDSRVIRNRFSGVIAQQSVVGASVTLSASNNIISNNVTGITAVAGSKVWASNNTVSGNDFGLVNDSSFFESTGNNAVRNNGTDTYGTITLVAPK